MSPMVVLHSASRQFLDPKVGRRNQSRTCYFIEFEETECLGKSRQLDFLQDRVLTEEKPLEIYIVSHMAFSWIPICMHRVKFWEAGQQMMARKKN